MEADSASLEGAFEPGSPGDPVEFGKHYLLGLIARGGMAEVYRARYSGDEPVVRPLAIKVMRPQLATDERFIDMFHREGKLAMLLKNRCIVETYDVGEVAGRHYITMEYVAGKDLTQVLRRCQETQQRVPVPHAVYIAARIAEGLHFAHNVTDKDGRLLNIVNRDVSPSNVRLSYDGDVKLLDFGIAQALMKFTSEIGILKGKFSYMSPEQIRGMPLDARTDVFSAGIILHEMLTTEKLFRGDTEFDLMERVRKAEVPPPSNFNRRVTAELNAICLKALARDVGDRYQSAAKLAEALDSLTAGYRFDPKELRQFLRQMFRKEYTQELQDAELAMSSLPTEIIGDKDTETGIGDRARASTHNPSADRNLSNIANVATEVLPSNGSSGNIRLPEHPVAPQHETENLTPDPITEPNMLGPPQSPDETPSPTKGFWNLWKKRK